MDNHFEQIEEILLRNKKDCSDFMDIIKPKIENANDEHERLYWHHIFEEEEQRFDRLNELLPKLNYYLENNDSQTSNNLEFVHLLQDISLEKFGLHNFEEHLDLGLYWYKDTEEGKQLQEMRDVTSNDYQSVKEILNQLNQKFNGVAMKAGSTPTDDKEDSTESLKAPKYKEGTNHDELNSINHATEKPSTVTNVSKKRLTVGSLKNKGAL